MFMSKYTVSDIVRDELTGKAKHVSKEVKADRLKICSDCSYFKKISRQCGICGCFLDVKCLHADSTCPLDAPKW
jgi:hypothetical protein